jgi:uncharacterized coiled-coil protein SlyX
VDLDWSRVGELLAAALGALGLAEGGRRGVKRLRRPAAEEHAEPHTPVPGSEWAARADVERLVTAVRHDAVEAQHAVEARLSERLTGQHAKISDLYGRDQALDARVARMEATVAQQASVVERLDDADRARERELGGVAARLDSMDSSLAAILALLRERDADRARERRP